LWQQLLKRLLALDCTSYEGFSTSGNTFVTVTGTCKLKGQRSFIAYNLLEGMNHIASFFQLHKNGLHVPLNSSNWAPVDCQKKRNREADYLDGEGGFISVVGEWCVYVCLCGGGGGSMCRHI